MLNLIFALALIYGSYFLLSRQASVRVWTISYALVALLISKYTSAGWFIHSLLATGFFILLFCAITPLRRHFLSKNIFSRISKAMPSMSATEREALEAGTVSWEGDLFSGAPDFAKLLNAPVSKLTAEETAFLAGPVAELCRMIDDWDITHNRTDMPPEMWQFIKDKGFLGMIIPKEYGGLDFSATAQVAILAKIYGRSITVGTTVSVPNSLGPAELLLKYGTQEQKDYYLPRLANGHEVPCFALTGPNAGSDAASIPDTGVVCKDLFNGQETLGIRLNWNKRYITLCPVATVIGLAFRLFDPENLLGKGKDVGISCALIPAELPGITKGRRHFPLNTGFLNGPTQGNNVFIPIDYLIGGASMAGMGWRMLMECLSAGRAISLPSSALGGTQAGALATGAYARVRRQFNQPIANFEGIEEPLARIAANTYIIDAALTMAAAAIDNGAKPSVAGAILKYHCTERGRQVSIDAMDIHGGKGICMGPKNYLARGYENAPIGITVEGANILTRNLIIFGQGAIRCHPFVYKELESVRQHNLVAFDKAFWGHAGFVLANLVKSIAYNIGDGRLTKAPASRVKRYYQLINRYSANLAFIADFSMGILGGALKRKEKISARLGDVLSYLYLASAVLKRYHDEGEPEASLPIVEWCCQHLLHECERAFRGVLTNFPVRWGGVVLKILIMPFGSQRHYPSDKLGHKLAKIISEPSEARDHLCRHAFKEAIPNCPIGELEETFLLLESLNDVARKIYKAQREGLLTALTFLEQVDEAEKAGILTLDEARVLRHAEQKRQEVIAVDDFNDDELRRPTIDMMVNKTKKSSRDDLSLETV